MENHFAQGEVDIVVEETEKVSFHPKDLFRGKHARHLGPVLPNHGAVVPQLMRDHHCGEDNTMISAR